MIRTDKKILVGFSGGIDSAVTVYLLKKAGQEPQAVHLILSGENKGSKKDKSLESIGKLADKLKVKLHSVDAEKEFREKIINRSLKEYKKGRTPNPCVICNEIIKFKKIAQKADELGIEKIATGHYVRKVEKAMPLADKKVWFLRKAQDLFKDQSYFLFNLKQDIISRAKFPLGEYTKEEIKEIGIKNNFFDKNYKESKGLCFIKESFGDFLSREIAEKKGKIIDQDNKILGEHEGLSKYTLGQRKDIGIGGQGPYFVAEKDYQKNVLLVSNIGDDPRLFHRKIFLKIAKEKRGILGNKATTQALISKGLYLKIRYGQKEEKVLSLERLKDNMIQIEIEKEVRAVTPGQCGVFYDREGTLILGGVIGALQSSRNQERYN